MKTTRDLLKESFTSLPNAFAYREVRFHVYQALQKLETLEKREAARKKSWLEDKQKEEEKKKTQNWQPPIYQSPSQIQQTIDILDKMIGEEKKVIEEIHAKKTKKGQVAQQEDDNEDDDLQTLHG
jgi:vacuolar-type H+-ATPase subunit I/STV1